MGIKFTRLLVCLLMLLVVTGAAVAQENTTSTTLPTSYRLNGITHIWQGWNNCGPATTTMALTYFGAAADQYPAAGWLKPNTEDKNVSPTEIIEYVNTQIPGTTKAMLRVGGDLELLKTLISNNFPVMIEAGYDPVNDDQGWMGHYLLVSGYDDAQGVFYTQDSYEGPNFTYTYDDTDFFWRHFNRLYIVFYEMTQEEQVLALLGDNADERQNVINALETARSEAVANPQDPFAWFNMGTNFNALGMYNEAATAFDQARNVGEGLPWRMMWYQFGPFEAYYQTGRYNDILILAQGNFTDGGGHFVEETFYYAGLAREALGETQRALDNYNQAVFLNSNYDEARAARDRLQNS